MLHGKIRALGNIFVLLAFLAFFFGGCSSAPKRPAAVYTDRNTATNLLDLAIKTANQGRYADALFILDEARVLAVSSDDPPLLIRTSVARGNFLFSLGRHGEAFVNWEEAILEGERSGEGNLTALVRIYTARGRLMQLIDSGQTGGIAEIRDQVSALVSSIVSDPLLQAPGFVTIGIAEKELGRYAEAEKSVRLALEIHENRLYLEDAAYDWFIIASVFSVAGRYNDALAALETSIGFDRRAENGFGLASSWQAMGEVYLKMGLPDQAYAAFNRSAGIFTAIGLDDLAHNAAARANNIYQ